jgi:hypothetical protein
MRYRDPFDLTPIVTSRAAFVPMLVRRSKSVGVAVRVGEPRPLVFAVFDLGESSDVIWVVCRRVGVVTTWLLVMTSVGCSW